MVGKLGDFLAGLDIPLHTSHVARGCQDAAIVDETAAGKVARVAGQFPGDARRTIALLVEVVNGANVVEAAAGDKVAAGSISAGHDPR